jgi:hypothetical protein
MMYITFGINTNHLLLEGVKREVTAEVTSPSSTFIDVSKRRGIDA